MNVVVYVCRLRSFYFHPEGLKVCECGAYAFGAFVHVCVSASIIYVYLCAFTSQQTLCVRRWTLSIGPLGADAARFPYFLLLLTGLHTLWVSQHRKFGGVGLLHSAHGTASDSMLRLHTHTHTHTRSTVQRVHSIIARAFSFHSLRALRLPARRDGDHAPRALRRLL